MAFINIFGLFCHAYAFLDKPVNAQTCPCKEGLFAGKYISPLQSSTIGKDSIQVHSIRIDLVATTIASHTEHVRDMTIFPTDNQCQLRTTNYCLFFLLHFLRRFSG